jgi:hypothetical protein
VTARQTFSGKTPPVPESGAKPNAQGALVGLAIRVYQGRQLFAEFANPSTLLREKVEQSRRAVIVIGNSLVEDQWS